MKSKIIFNGKEYIKYGKTNDGRQRFQQKEDKSILTEGSKVRCTTEMKYMAIFLYYNGLTFNKISKIFNVSYVTISNWLIEFSIEIKNKYYLSDVSDVVDIEIDEIFHFINNKKKEFTFLPQLIEKHIK